MGLLHQHDPTHRPAGDALDAGKSRACRRVTELRQNTPWPHWAEYPTDDGRRPIKAPAIVTDSVVVVAAAAVVRLAGDVQTAEALVLRKQDGAIQLQEVE